MMLIIAAACSLAATAQFNVTYTGFTPEQETAFNYATSLWEPLLNSEVPIKINARFQTVAGFGVITIPNLIFNFSATPVANVWFCNALANALTGIELNPGEADVDFIINPNEPWYFGLDGNCPTGSFDFVSEMHKAIPYGLGYMSSFYIQNVYGSYGMLNPAALGLTASFPWENMQNFPVLYDTFVVSPEGHHLVDTSHYANPSTGLRDVLTGGSLYYAGSYGMEFGGGDLPSLYASTFNLARTARLLSTVYIDTENAPGVPTLVYGPGYRYPSPIVLGMLKDQGWQLNLESLCTPPANLSAEVLGNDVTLNWEIPVGDYVIHAIHIFRDGVEIAVSDQVAGPYLDADLAAGTYEYTIQAAYSMDYSPASNSATAMVSTSVEDEIGVNIVSELQVYPNPVRVGQQLTIASTTKQPLEVDIYNAKGQKINTLMMDKAGALIWNLQDRDGSKLPSGIYFIKQTHSSTAKPQKLIVF